VLQEEFAELVAPYRTELHVHCYRLTGSVQDAEDALQEAMFGAWRGIDRFEGRSSLRSWLYRIATNACLRLLRGRPPRLLSADYGPAFAPDADLGGPRPGPWLEPYPDRLIPEERYELRESVELAFVAALQHLPANQRAVLILREVLAYSAAEVAEALDTSVASVNSALQRARKTVAERVPERSQQENLAALGTEGERELVEALVAAWEKGDVEAIRSRLTADARFTMPPLAAWFDGRDDIVRFLSERVFASSWRLIPVRAGGRLAFVCYQDERLSALNVLTLDQDRITEITAFLEPSVIERFC
jgi:RNA polymerase sigma-70 factor (TIGR02960 family)